MKIKFFLSLLLNLCFITSWSQSFQIGHKQQTFVDASRSNRTITAEIYYPAATAGDNVSIALGPFPVLVFGHGFVMDWSAYLPEWNALVPNGYIMVFPTTESSIIPSHENFGKDIAYLIGAMKAQGADSASTFFDAVSNTSAVMGHSMGGGSAFLAVEYDSSITALATLAAANTNPSSIAAAASISIPSIVFSASNDCVTPPAEHQLPMYNSLSSNCKTFVSITGGSHCQFAKSNFNCSFGEGTCSPQPTITPAAQQATTLNLLLPWLNYYLKNDQASGVQFQDLITAGNGITTQQNCSLSPTNLGNVAMPVPVQFFPNPFSISTTLQSNVALENATLSVFDTYGKVVLEMNNINGKTIVLSRKNLASGLYFFRITEGNQTIVRSKFIITD